MICANLVKVDQGCLENIVIMALEEWPGYPFLKNILFLSYTNNLCQVWFKSPQWCWNEKFQISPMYFHNFFLSTTSLNISLARKLCVKFGSNWHFDSKQQLENVKSLWSLWHTGKRTDDRRVGDDKSSPVIQGS